MKKAMHLIVLSVMYAQASKDTASSLSFYDCSTSVARARQGDTVYFPYEKSRQWKKGIEIHDKSIHILGIPSGNSKPAIIDSITSTSYYTGALFWFDVRATDTVQVSNISFKTMCLSPWGVICIFTSKAARIDHCDFYDSLEAKRSFWYQNGATGVVDNCLIKFHLNSSAQGGAVLGTGDKSWTEPSSYGTIDNVFIEDCVYDFAYPCDGAFDAYNGARIVFRHNSSNVGFGWHGFDSGRYRSVFSVEIYDNSITRYGSSNEYCWCRSRGGSCLVYNNKISGNFKSFFWLSSYRSCPSYKGVHTGGNGTNVLTDASAHFVTGSPAATYVYKTETSEWDTVKSRTETTLTSDLTWNTGDKYTAEYYPIECGMCQGYSPCDSNRVAVDSGYPCRDQIGRGTNQSLSPVYAWNNVFNGDTAPSFSTGSVCSLEKSHIRRNRDYYENTPKPGYIPFTYPHPLRKSDTSNTSYNPGIIKIRGAGTCQFSIRVGNDVFNARVPSINPSGVVRARIITIAGRTVCSRVTKTRDVILPVPAAGYSRGVYILNLSVGDGIECLTPCLLLKKAGH